MYGISPYALAPYGVHLGYGEQVYPIRGVTISRRTKTSPGFIFSTKNVNKQYQTRKSRTGQGFIYATKLVKEG